MKRFVRLIRWWILVPFLRTGRWGIRLIPWTTARALGRMLGCVGWFLSGRDRRRTQENLARVFPDRTPGERTALGKSAFQHTAMELCEFLHSGREDTDTILSRVLNQDELQRVIALGYPEEGQPGRIFVTAHIGNWEYLGAVAARAGCRLLTFARRMKQKTLENLVAELRAEHSLPVMYTDASPSAILRMIRDGHSISILPDHDITDIEGMFLPFFGHQAWTPLAPARLTYLSKTELWTVFLIREGDGFRLRVSGPFLPDRDLPRDEALWLLTKTWTRELESVIMDYPEQWCWMHPRWRNTPERICRHRKTAPLVADAEGTLSRWSGNDT